MIEAAQRNIEIDCDRIRNSKRAYAADLVSDMMGYLFGAQHDCFAPESVFVFSIVDFHIARGYYHMNGAIGFKGKRLGDSRFRGAYR
jgi:hypothetical protein